MIILCDQPAAKCPPAEIVALNTLWNLMLLSLLLALTTPCYYYYFIYFYFYLAYFSATSWTEWAHRGVRNTPKPVPVQYSTFSNSLTSLEWVVASAVECPIYVSLLPAVSLLFHTDNKMVQCFKINHISLQGCSLVNHKQRVGHHICYNCGGKPTLPSENTSFLI